MAIKKSDLYSSLRQSCDELRGGMDASQYKDYFLFMLFIKYIAAYAVRRQRYIAFGWGGTHCIGRPADIFSVACLPKGAIVESARHGCDWLFQWG